MTTAENAPDGDAVEEPTPENVVPISGEVELEATGKADAEKWYGRGADGFMMTDLGNAQCFAAKHAGEVLHVPGSGWYCWDGRRWKHDDKATKVTRLAGHLVRNRRAGLDKVKAEAGLAMMKWSKESESAAKIAALLKLAATQESLVTEASTLDADRTVLNARNGTIDLRTGTLRPHDPIDYITKLTDIDYTPEAMAPEFEKFLLEFSEYREEFVDYLCRFCGYTATGEQGERKVLVLDGSGNNGKSVLVRCAKAVLGEYAVAGPSTLLLYTGLKRHDGDTGVLVGHRLVTSSELPVSARWDEQFMKSLTSNDGDADYRKLYEERRNFKPVHTIWVDANHFPAISGNDDAAWNRLAITPCEHIWRENAEGTNTNFADDLIATELEGMLAWIVAGAVAWYAGGLQPPECVIAHTRALRASRVPEERWMLERLIDTPDYVTSFEALKADYHEWCSAQSPKVEREARLSDKALHAKLGRDYARARRTDEEGVKRRGYRVLLRDGRNGPQAADRTGEATS